MNVRKMFVSAGIVIASVSSLKAQITVGADLPNSIGFSQAAPSFPLEDVSEFDFSDLEGQVGLIVYHASW